jgi:primosomal protein N' (replication factor Y) (superfamily II helicase)
MKLLSVIPIARGINKENLSYFTSSDVSIGCVVKVPLRKKTIPAIVVKIEDVADVKAEIKNASFETRKIETRPTGSSGREIKSTHFLTPEFIQTVTESALYFASTSGSIIHSIVPKNIIEEVEKIKYHSNQKQIDDINKKHRSHEKLIIQSDDEERYATYKSLIREEFAKGYSVFFCLPTIQDIKKAHEKLSKGIEQYTFVLHSLLSTKEQIELWSKATKEEHPSLIISTGSFLGIPRNDIGTIIVDKENTRSYKSQVRPFIDVRIFAENFAQKINAKIIFGDLLLRTETVWRHSENEIFELTPLKFRSLTTSVTNLINMREIVSEKINSDKNNVGKEPKFKLFSNDLLNLIEQNHLNDENLFIFVARRGLSPSTVCGDCNNLVKCNTCGAPTILHKASSENFFLCHRCGEHRSAMEKCQNCQSWRLSAFGIGIEAVEEELKEKFPNIKVFKLDSDSASTHKKALDTVAKFYTSPGSILLGTEMALLYLKDAIANTAVVSIDSFFSIPDFRINEKVMNILLKIRAFTSRNFLVQTRDIDQNILKYATTGNLADFYRDEIKERKTLLYPPFSIPIKITLQGDKKTVLAGMEELQKIMSPYEVDIFPAFIPLQKGKFSMHGLLKIKRQEWIDHVLLDKLNSLSPQYTINVDPESLL